MFRSLLVVGVLAATGCVTPEETPAETCVTTVNDADVCVEFHGTAEHCQTEWSGTPYSSQDGAYLCDDLGFEIRCDGRVIEQGSNYTVEFVFRASSEEDCEEAAGGIIGD